MHFSVLLFNLVLQTLDRCRDPAAAMDETGGGVGGYRHHGSFTHEPAEGGKFVAKVNIFLYISL